MANTWVCEKCWDELNAMEARMKGDLELARKSADRLEARELEARRAGLAGRADDYERMLLRTLDRIEDLERWLGPPVTCGEAVDNG